MKTDNEKTDSKKTKKRYVVTESKNCGKLHRFHVVDTVEKRLIRGQLSKENAIGLEGFLNGKPHKKKEM